MNKSHSYSLHSSLIQFEIDSTLDNTIPIPSISQGPHYIFEILPRRKIFILNRGTNSLVVEKFPKGDILSTLTLPGSKIVAINYLRNYDLLAVLSVNQKPELSFYKLHNCNLHKIRTVSFPNSSLGISETFLALEYFSTSNTLYILSDLRIFCFSLKDKRPGITHERKAEDPGMTHFKILERPGLLAFVANNVINIYPLNKDGTLNLKKKPIKLSEDKHQISTIVWSEREDMLYTAGQDNCVKRWMVKGNLGVICDSINVDRPVVGMVVFPVTDIFVIKNDLGELTFYKMASGENVLSFPADEDGNNGNQLGIFENEMKLLSPEKNCLKVLQFSKIDLYKKLEDS